MLATPLTCFAVALMVKWQDGEVDGEVSILLPSIIDLFALYIVGMYLGVF